MIEKVKEEVRLLNKIKLNDKKKEQKSILFLNKKQKLDEELMFKYETLKKQISLLENLLEVEITNTKLDREEEEEEEDNHYHGAGGHQTGQLGASVEDNEHLYEKMEICFPHEIFTKLGLIRPRLFLRLDISRAKNVIAYILYNELSFG